MHKELTQEERKEMIKLIHAEVKTHIEQLNECTKLIVEKVGKRPNEIFSAQMMILAGTFGNMMGTLGKNKETGENAMVAFLEWSRHYGESLGIFHAHTKECLKNQEEPTN